MYCWGHLFNEMIDPYILCLLERHNQDKAFLSRNANTATDSNLCPCLMLQTYSSDVMGHLNYNMNLSLQTRGHEADDCWRREGLQEEAAMSLCPQTAEEEEEAKIQCSRGR